MKRTDITGFTMKIFGYFIEFVFIKKWLKVIAISKPQTITIKRWEI